MKRVIVAALLVGAYALTPVHGPRAQAPKFGDNPIRHVGVIVPDVDVAARASADVLGIPVPETRAVPGIPFPDDYAGDRNAHPKVAMIRLANMSIELLQPMGGKSPWRDHLDQFGPGLHHVAFGVPDIGQAVTEIQKLGGRYVLGKAGYQAAYVDMKPILGFTFELIQNSPASAPPPAAPAPVPTNFGMGNVSHVGIFVPDVEKTARVFSELTGLPVPMANEYKGMVFPAGFSGDKDAHPKIISFRYNPIGLEFVQPMGGASPWSDHVNRFGPSMHHLAIGIQGMQANIDYLTKKGGKLTVGPGPGYAFVDLKPSPLGFCFELNGK
jgi:catechol 2,3-dioxygenase-like lactoylglutathione lyase family enzyme